MGAFFTNYETIKLDVVQPNVVNLLLIILFIAVTVMSSKKNVIAGNSNILLSVSHTEQLKGIGIFFVVLGHLWVHVSSAKPQIVLSGEAVSLFLVLSGFGLVSSCRDKMYSFKEFFIKRIKRVMLPYWIITTFILIIDYFLLGRKLQIVNLLMTYIGINTNVELWHLDYARWFVTFILLQYLLFFLAFQLFRTNKYKMFFLFGSAFVLLPMDYYIFQFGWYQFFAFPAGCMLAFYYKDFISFFNKNENKIIISALICTTYVLLFKIIMRYGPVKLMITSIVPNIFLTYIFDINSLVISLAIVFVSCSFIKFGSSSKFLLFLGKYSYEIFLIHGVILVRYNPVIISRNTYALTGQFYLFLILVISISMICQKLYNISNYKIATQKI